MASGQAPSGGGNVYTGYKKKIQTGGGLKAPGWTGESPANTPGAGTPTTNPYIDPAIKSAAFDILGSITKGAGALGSPESLDLASNRLRERVGQVAKQQRQGIVDNFVGRGLGASPALYGDNFIGGVNAAEQTAMAQGINQLLAQNTQDKIAGLNALSGAFQGYLGMGNLDFNANSFLAKLLQDQSQFNSSLANSANQFNKDYELKKKQMKQSDYQYLLQLLNSLGITG